MASTASVVAGFVVGAVADIVMTSSTVSRPLVSAPLSVISSIRSTSATTTFASNSPKLCLSTSPRWWKLIIPATAPHLTAASISSTDWGELRSMMPTTSPCPTPLAANTAA